jgi:hypothetical protein
MLCPVGHNTKLLMRRLLKKSIKPFLSQSFVKEIRVKFKNLKTVEFSSGRTLTIYTQKPPENEFFKDDHIF